MLAAQSPEGAPQLPTAAWTRGQAHGGLTLGLKSRNPCPYRCTENPISPQSFLLTGLAPRRSPGPVPKAGVALFAAPGPPPAAGGRCLLFQAASPDPKAARQPCSRVLQIPGKSALGKPWKEIPKLRRVIQEASRAHRQRLQPAQGTAAPADPKTRGVILSEPANPNSFGVFSPLQTPKLMPQGTGLRNDDPWRGVGPVTHKQSLPRQRCGTNGARLPQCHPHASVFLPCSSGDARGGRKRKRAL